MYCTWYVIKWTDIKLNWIKIGINTYQELVYWNWIMKSETPNPIPDPTISFHHHGNPERIRNGHCLEMSKILKSPGKSWKYLSCLSCTNRSFGFIRPQNIVRGQWVLCFICAFLFSTTCSCWLAFYESRRTTVSAKNLSCSTQEKYTYILDGRSLLSIWILQQKALK